MKHWPKPPWLDTQIVRGFPDYANQLPDPNAAVERLNKQKIEDEQKRFVNFYDGQATNTSTPSQPTSASTPGRQTPGGPKPGTNPRKTTPKCPKNAPKSGKPRPARPTPSQPTSASTPGRQTPGGPKPGTNPSKTTPARPTPGANS